MISFKQFYLTESLQKVYHALDIRALRSILKDDKLELSPNVLGVEKQMGAKKHYFLSTMRNKSGTYFLGISKNTKYPMKDAYIELDADYLSDHMKSAPVDYWGAGRKGSEEEERFWSNDDSIGNVGKFIKSIHILLDKDEERQKKQRQLYVDIHFYALFKKIPVYFYDNTQNFVAGKKPVEYDIGKDFYSDKTKSDYVSEIEFVIKLMKGDKITGKMKEQFGRQIAWPMYRDDFVTQLVHQIHGSRKQTTNTDREFVREFMDIYKKSKRNSIAEFVEKDVTAKMKERHLM